MIISKASINIGDFDIKLSAFADDTHIFNLRYSVTLSHTRYLFRVWGLLVIKTYSTGHSQHNTDFAKTNQNEVKLVTFSCCHFISA